METTPLVSIIIPVYNGAKYMREAIDSALCQTYKNTEVIVVNDGSADETDEIAKSYGERIRYFKKENGGCASALNYGISKMNGEWFSWLSHDDVYLKDKIEKSIECAKEHGITDNYIIGCGTSLIDGNGNGIFRPVHEREGALSNKDLFSELLFGVSVNGCALLIHKSVLEKVGAFDETLTYTPDWDYWLRASLCGVGLYSIPAPLCKNRVHSGQVSVVKSNLAKTDRTANIDKIRQIADKNGDDFYINRLWLYCNYAGDMAQADKIRQNPAFNGKKSKGLELRIRGIAVRFAKAVYRTVFKKGMN